ncbi:hypothetical protein OPQ81_003532 [Rhizoctonia solani]|nr:hypothetical protein OPQ81_003532 [Rhizoctonia solani]
MASRSTLGADQHTIPLFYACYLLRSMKTKSSSSTYVGSTPDPPRRLRQHNGELTQGASKTRRGRPWVMTMIVYGFPSKLAALQFEWAWQHPYMSRHIRVSQTKQGKEIYFQIFKRDSQTHLLRTKILAARTMLSISPYNTWPLHVKIFTEEAKRLWDEIQPIKTIQALPMGLTVSFEFEGVDGKAPTTIPRRPNARTGPIEVKDTDFTLSHIHKYQSLIKKDAQLRCSVCSSQINIKHSDHLRVALCPQTGCKAVSHLDCLAQSFLKHPSNPPGLIPRGGVCESCNQYTLWGDVVRGCYRRARASLQQPSSEQESEGDDEETAEIGDDLSRHLENLQISGSPRKVTKPLTGQATTSKKKRTRVTQRSAQIERLVDSDVEDFTAEMDAIDWDTGDSEPDRPLWKGPSAVTTSRKHAPKLAEPDKVCVNHDKPRDMDEIVRQALSNLSICTPSESNHLRPAESSRAKSPTVTKRLGKSTNTKGGTGAIVKGQASISADLEKRARSKSPKPGNRRTPSPEYIDLDGI